MLLNENRTEITSPAVLPDEIRTQFALSHGPGRGLLRTAPHGDHMRECVAEREPHGDHCLTVLPDENRTEITCLAVLLNENLTEITSLSVLLDENRTQFALSHGPGRGLLRTASGQRSQACRCC